MTELKLKGRVCVFCKNPARWRGETVKEDDIVTCGNCQCHASVKTIMELESALELQKSFPELKEKSEMLDDIATKIFNLKHWEFTYNNVAFAVRVAKEHSQKINHLESHLFETSSEIIELFVKWNENYINDESFSVQMVKLIPLDKYNEKAKELAEPDV